MIIDFVTTKRELSRLLDRCHGVADKKSAVPALANVLLTADGKALRVAATDLYLAMSGEIPAEIATPGAIALPAKDLFERVKAMNEGPVHITADAKGQATIKSVGNARRYTLHGLLGTDFPVLPQPEGDALTLPVDLFAMLMHRTHFSISTDETRAHVNSALFEWAGHIVRMVSTDGHRLSKMEATVERDGLASMLIPLKAIGELRRLCDHAKSEKATEIEIRRDKSTAFFDVAGLRFSCKLVDAAFPPYQQVIPQIGRETSVPRIKFAEALKAVSLAASDRTGGVKIALSSGALRVTAESPESGNAEDVVDVDYAGPEVTIGVNAKYILDVLAAVDHEAVRFGAAGELDPMTLRVDDGGKPDEPGYVAVIMPVRL